MSIIEKPECELQEGIVHKKITHDYILDLYEDIEQKEISKKEKANQLKVLDILAEHIGEFMILKCNPAS